MQITLIDSTCKKLHSEVTVKYESLFHNICGLTAEYNRLLDNWATDSKKILNEDNIFTEHFDNLTTYKRDPFQQANCECGGFCKRCKNTF